MYVSFVDVGVDVGVDVATLLLLLIMTSHRHVKVAEAALGYVMRPQPLSV